VVAGERRQLGAYPLEEVHRVAEQRVAQAVHVDAPVVGGDVLRVVAEELGQGAGRDITGGPKRKLPSDDRAQQPAVRVVDVAGGPVGGGQPSRAREPACSYASNSGFRLGNVPVCTARPRTVR